MTGHGSSVGPGIMRIGRVCTCVKFSAALTVISPALDGRAILSGTLSGVPGGVGGHLWLPLIAVDEVEVARLDEQAGGLTQDEDGIAPIDGVGEQREAA